MSHKRPLWLLTGTGVQKFESGEALAVHLGTTANCIFSAFSQRRSKIMPAKWKNRLFWNYDPKDTGPQRMRDAEHKRGEPLLVGNPTHHIGAWR